MPTTSGSLGLYVFADSPTPSLVFYEWDVTEFASPVGYRNVESGIASYVKQLSSSGNDYLQFDNAVIDFSTLEAEYASTVQCFTCINSSPSYVVSELKFWASASTALVTGTHLEYAPSGTWWANAVLPSGAGTVIPTSLPASPNVLNQDDESYVLDGVSDGAASQFVYLGLTIASGVTLGRYGAGGTGDLDLRMTFNWYNKNIQVSE